MFNVLDYGDQPGLGAICDGIDSASAKIYNLVLETLKARGLFSLPLNTQISIPEFMDKLELDTGINHRIDSIIEILEQIHVLKREGDNLSIKGDIEALHFDDALIEKAYGEGFDEYLEFYRAGLFLEPEFHIAFDVNNDDWERQMRTVPMNQLANNLAVEWTSANSVQGGFVDLAFGPTYSLERLRKLSDQNQSVVGIDLSSNFCKRARERFAQRGLNIDVIEADLNDGLGKIATNSMRGVMFLGAGHFINDLDALSREVHRILVPGGHYSLGQVITNYESFSSPAFRLHAAILNPPAVPKDVVEVENGLRSSGFEIRFTTQFGPYRSMFAEKR